MRIITILSLLLTASVALAEDAPKQTVFGQLVQESWATFLLQGTILTDVEDGALEEERGPTLLQGTILTDVEETVAGVKRQHNILAQLGIDTREMYGYTLVEPLIQLRKPAVRVVAQQTIV